MRLIWMRRAWHGEARVVRLREDSYLVGTRLRGGIWVEYELRDRAAALARGRAWADVNLPKSAKEWGKEAT